MSQPNRIHIIGGPGSGKTTLAASVARCLDVAASDLDTVAFEDGAGPGRPFDVRLREVERISAEDSWVTEGVYIWWTDQLLERADVIVWLDIDWRVAAWRIVLRHLRATLAGNNRHPGIRRLIRFLIWSRYYYRRPDPVPLGAPDDTAINRAATERELQRSLSKLVRCTRSSEAEAFLRWLSASPVSVSAPQDRSEVPLH